MHEKTNSTLGSKTVLESVFSPTYEFKGEKFKGDEPKVFCLSVMSVSLGNVYILMKFQVHGAYKSKAYEIGAF